MQHFRRSTLNVSLEIKFFCRSESSEITAILFLSRRKCGCTVGGDQHYFLRVFYAHNFLIREEMKQNFKCCIRSANSSDLQIGRRM